SFLSHPATTLLYTLSLHDALPIFSSVRPLTLCHGHPKLYTHDIDMLRSDEFRSGVLADLQRLVNYRNPLMAFVEDGGTTSTHACELVADLRPRVHLQAEGVDGRPLAVARAPLNLVHD